MVELRSGNQEFLCVFVRVHEPKVGPYENRFQLFHFTGEGWGMAPVSPPTGSAISGQFMTIVFGTVVEVCYTFFCCCCCCCCAFMAHPNILQRGSRSFCFTAHFRHETDIGSCETISSFYWFFDLVVSTDCDPLIVHFRKTPFLDIILDTSTVLRRVRMVTGVTHGWGFVW